MAAAIAWFVFGALTAALSLRMPLGTPTMPGTGAFPFLLGLGLMGLAAGQGVREFLARPRAPAPPPAATGPGPGRRVALFLGGIVLGAALLAPAGFIVSGFVLMLALLAALGMRRWPVAVAISAASSLASWVIFVRWLGIPMPAGWMF